jgi:hypothetical protein
MATVELGTLIALTVPVAIGLSFYKLGTPGGLPGLLWHVAGPFVIVGGTTLFAIKMIDPSPNEELINLQLLTIGGPAALATIATLVVYALAVFRYWAVKTSNS